MKLTEMLGSDELLEEGLSLNTFLFREDNWVPCSVSKAFGGDGSYLVELGHESGAKEADFSFAPAFTDWHVHSSLSDLSALEGSPVVRVLDLGSDPKRVGSESTRRLEEESVQILFAGAFITPAGGYPSDRSWKESGSVREVFSASDAAEAVQEMKDSGASCLKIAQNSVAGPVFSQEELTEIVSLGHELGLPSVVHAEGPGEAQKARLAGAKFLAHTPFAEALSRREVLLQAESLSWISTLDIHGYGDYGSEYHTAIYNLSRFAGADGRVFYGTDMGNGPTPFALNAREIRALQDAGLTEIQVLQALIGDAPLEKMVAIPGKPGALKLVDAKLFPGRILS